MPVGGQPGNRNAARTSSRLWGDTLKRAVMHNDGAVLREIAESLLAKAKEGDISAIKELADRLDGKSHQQVILAGDPDNPVTFTELVRKIVK